MKETLEGQYLVILSSQGLFYTIKSASRGYMLADFRRGGMKPFRKHSAEQLIIGKAWRSRISDILSMVEVTSL